MSKSDKVGSGDIEPVIINQNQEVKKGRCSCGRSAEASPSKWPVVALVIGIIGAIALGGGLESMFGSKALGDWAFAAAGIGAVAVAVGIVALIVLINRVCEKRKEKKEEAKVQEKVNDQNEINLQRMKARAESINKIQDQRQKAAAQKLTPFSYNVVDDGWGFNRYTIVYAGQVEVKVSPEKMNEEAMDKFIAQNLPVNTFKRVY